MICIVRDGKRDFFIVESYGFNEFMSIGNPEVLATERSTLVVFLHRFNRFSG